MDLSRSDLFKTYNKVKVIVRERVGQKGVQRLNKALGILMSRDYFVQEREFYFPSLHSCGCPDFQFRLADKRAYRGPCKHIIAVRMVHRLSSNRRK